MRGLSMIGLLTLLAGCSAKDAVSLSVRISQSAITVRQGAFGGSLSGSFQVQLTVGPEASGPSTVMPQSFSLNTESGMALVDALKVESDATFPLSVGKGETKSVKFTIEPSAIDHDAACAGPLKVLGSFSDSLKGGTEPVQSDPIVPGCDPGS